MASPNGVPLEGASTNRPPFFNGNGYAYWKNRMQIFIEAIDIDIWDAIEYGAFVPTKVVNNEVIEKPRNEWTDEEKKKVQLNAKAKNIITSALGMDEYFRIASCKTAKEMWDTLQVTHEGTSEVKRARINTLTHEYELFRMKQGESVQDMQKRFTHITTHLSSLGKTYENEDLVNKVLRCLSREWQPKVTAICESRDLAKMNLATLFGKLQEHEMELSRLHQNEDADKKKRSIALKASSSSHEENEEDDTEGGEPNEEIMNLLVRNFGKAFKKSFRRKGRFPKKSSKGEGHSSNPPTCFECGKLGHMRMDCPNLQKKNINLEKKSYKDKKKAKKAYVAWDDNDLSSSDESSEEEANLCFMANEDSEVNSLNSSNMIYDNDELEYDELYKGSIKLAKSLHESHKTISSLETKIAKLSYEIEELKLENETLGLLDSTCTLQVNEPHACSLCNNYKNEIEDLKKVLSNFTNGRKNLDTLLSHQRCAFSKAGLGYKQKEKSYKNFFSPSITSTSKTITCYYCGNKGHSATICKTRKYGHMALRKVWVPIGIIPTTNTQGPKNIVGT